MSSCSAALVSSCSAALACSSDAISRSPNLPPGAATGVSPSLIQLKAMVAAHYNVEPDQVHNFDTQKLEQLEARMDEIADHLPPKAAI